VTSSQSWTRSIVKQETSLDGLSLNVFRTPWGHATISVSENPVPGRVHGVLSGGGYDFSFEGESSSREAALRIAAHFIVFAMPPGGLDETVSTLGEIAEFHNERALVTPALPSPGRTHIGRVVEVAERSPLTLSE
jgi:hypothetical protein